MRGSDERDQSLMSIGNDPEAVLRDLLYLRKGVGFNDVRFGRAQALRAVLGGDDEPSELLTERFQSAISSLRDADAELMFAVSGLTLETRNLPDLKSRRDYLARRLGIGRDAVADRDVAAIARLRHQLLSGWYPKSPVSLRVPETHNGLVNELVHVTTFVRNRRHVASLHNYSFYCTFDGAQYTAFTAANDVLVVVLGGEFRLESEDLESGVLHRFWHDSPMERGRLYNLRFRIDNPNPNEREWLTEESLAFHEPTRQASFHVVFEGHRPSVAWSFSGLTARERPGRPRPSALTHPKLPQVVANATFHDLYGGLFAGIAWEWPAFAGAEP